jgi:hypothetical protein
MVAKLGVSTSGAGLGLPTLSSLYLRMACIPIFHHQADEDLDPLSTFKELRELRAQEGSW